MSEWFVGLGYEVQLATWLVASFILSTLASQLAWQFQWYFPGDSFTEGDHGHHQTPDQYWERDGESGWLAGRLRDYLLIPWLVEAIRFVYYMGIPFLAAVNGLLPADLLGISGNKGIDSRSTQGFPWEDWVQGLGLALAAVVVIMGVWFVGRVVSRHAGLVPSTQGLPNPLWQRLLHAVYDQIHWAFYRSGPILWLGDVYWGTFVGLALVLLETALNPALWWSLKSPDTAGPPLFRLGMVWISALLFLATQNLWLSIGVHLVLAGLLVGREGNGYLDVYELSE
jgi:hypothetical protein